MLPPCEITTRPAGVFLLKKRAKIGYFLTYHGFICIFLAILIAY